MHVQQQEILVNKVHLSCVCSITGLDWTRLDWWNEFNTKNVAQNFPHCLKKASPHVCMG